MKLAPLTQKLAMTGVALLSGASPAMAHDGHRLSVSHWHATDAWGLIALAVAVAVATWFSRGK